MSFQKSHPLLKETALAYSGSHAMGGFFDDIQKSLSTEWDKVKSQASTQLEAEKQKAIQQGLTSVQTAATSFVNQQAQQLLNDPKRIEEVRQSTVPKIVDQVSKNVITPVVDFATKNPAKTAMIAGGILVGLIVMMTFAGKGAVAGLVSRKTNPRRKKARKSRK